MSLGLLGEDRGSGLYRPDFGPNLNKPRHGWYPFKEGFSASLVAKFLLDHSTGGPGVVLDPFGGSGTTALEAASWGWTALTAEVNPFMAFLCRTKCEREYQSEELARLYRSVVSNGARGRRVLPRDSTLVERPGLARWLLNAGVARRFETIRARIELEVKSPAYRRLLMLALILATTRAANAKRDGKCWRYRRSWDLRRFSGADVDSNFDEAVSSYADDLRVLGRLPGKAHVYSADCREWLPKAMRRIEGKVDVVLTSPPYLNSFDYTDIYRPECYLLGAARTASDLRTVRLRTLRSHVQVDWPSAPVVGQRSVRRIVRALERKALWDRRIPGMVNAYFFDLQTVMGLCRRSLRQGGTLGLVVATSAYGGVVVPVDEIVGQIAEGVGFAVDAIQVLRYTAGNGHHQNRSAKKLREALVVARAV